MNFPFIKGVAKNAYEEGDLYQTDFFRLAALLIIIFIILTGQNIDSIKETINAIARVIKYIFKLGMSIGLIVLNMIPTPIDIISIIIPIFKYSSIKYYSFPKKKRKEALFKLLSYKTPH
jgi:hypothetical protein